MTREPQQDRSKATRQALLAATVEVLAADGWGPTTVSHVASVAGVSRGAAQHHFSTRDQLILGAVTYMFDERSKELLAEQPAPDPAETRPARIRRIVGTIVDHCCSDLFKAALHVWTAAASDAALREIVVPAEAELSRDVFAHMAREIGVDLGHEPSRRALQTTLDLARGLGLSSVLTDDSVRREKVVDAWAADLARTLEFTETAPPAAD